MATVFRQENRQTLNSINNKIRVPGECTENPNIPLFCRVNKNIKVIVVPRAPYRCTMTETDLLAKSLRTYNLTIVDCMTFVTVENCLNNILRLLTSKKTLATHKFTRVRRNMNVFAERECRTEENDF